jgi:hypothetical protein
MRPVAIRAKSPASCPVAAPFAPPLYQYSLRSPAGVVQLVR